LTKSQSGAKPDLKGNQQPRISCVPPYTSSTGQEAVELAQAAGLILDPWEELVLRESLGERADGKWSAFEVGLVVARQNGKGSILEARELAGLFLLGEQLIVHSAHEFATAMEHFRRMEQLIEGCPDLYRLVAKMPHSHGEEGIELKNGQRLRFRTRTKGGLRGFTGDLIVFDEAMILPTASHGAILPTLSAKSILGNPQVWYTASAVDQWIHEHGEVLAGVRERGIKGDDPALAFFEWSVAAKNPEEVGELANDPEGWAQANPGLGIRISAEHIEREQRSMDPRTFAVERLGVGDWPSTDGSSGQVISEKARIDCIDLESEAEDPVVLTFDVTPDRSFTSIGCAGRRPDGTEGKWHVEVIDRRPGTGWVVARMIELRDKWQPFEIACDGNGPAASLIGPLAKAGIDVKVIDGKELGKACGVIFDAFEETELRHLDTDELNAAIKGAAKRPLGDAWAWSRKTSSVDISPLVAVTVALWEASQGDSVSVYEERDLLVLD
jgi:hypothetical protein